VGENDITHNEVILPVAWLGIILVPGSKMFLCLTNKTNALRFRSCNNIRGEQ